jgi:uncharacterized protein
MDVDWRNVLIILALTAGHIALLIAVINRLHARPWPRALLHHLGQIDDILIVTLPALFVWQYGMSEPRLLSGGSWHLLPTPLLCYLAVCGVVALAIPANALIRWRSGPPACQMTNHTQRVDISRRLGFRPIGPGPLAFMARLPGNECFQLDVSDKEYCLPRLPAAWDGLSILQLSDLHLTGAIDRPYFEQVVEIARTMPSDLVVFTGDLLDREDLIDWLPATLGRLTAPLGCYFVLGNHDWYLKNTTEIRRRLESLGWRDIAGACEQVWHRGHTLAICGTELPWMGRHPDLSTVPEEAFRLLLSHTPDNLPWARRARVDVMLAGHNHGGQIRLPGFGPVYSPSSFGGLYAGGAFHVAPTLLYVNRGISGRHPLRWNCPPELTRLLLRAVL